MINNYLKNITKIKKYNEKKEKLNKNYSNIIMILETNIINHYEYIILNEFKKDYDLYLYYINISTNNDLKSLEYFKNINNLFNKILVLIIDNDNLKENEIYFKLNKDYMIKYNNLNKFKKLLKELIITILNKNKNYLDQYNYY